MAPAGDPHALGEMLRSRRGRLAPEDVGLPAGRRRRTPGLRREEVALLASVSPTYYAFLEQGRQVQPSGQVVDALAVALRMNQAETHYLHALAGGGETVVVGGPELLDPGVAGLVARLAPAPTYVKGRRWDILAFNPEACELFTDWAAKPPDERNHVLWMFTSDEARLVYIDWEREARAMLGRFRLAASRWQGDAAFADLIERLHRESDLVRRWWPQHHVAAIGSGVKRLRHPRLGVVDYAHVVLQVADDPYQTLVTFTPTETSVG